jgi:hypothetical protein
MRFTYLGDEFLIEFQRESKVPMGSFYGVKRTYTTARLLQVTGLGRTDRKVIREYSVGHNPRDLFSLDAGRKAALAMALYDAPTKGGGAPLMGTPLSKAFRTAVWEAYFDR